MNMMVKRHYVISMQDSETAELRLMKDWLRRHLELLPPGTDPTYTTSHQLREMLRKRGWRMEEQSDRVVLIEPDQSGGFSYAVDLLEIDDEVDGQEENGSEEITFGLERDLQVALRSDISQLENGMAIIDGGYERITEAGRIDITSVDSQDRIVVIELKAGTAQPLIVAQIMAYVAAVESEDAKPVRAIIVAGDFNPRVILAARAIPNLMLRQYTYQFTFLDIS